MTLRVVKLGGAALADAAVLDALGAALAAAPVPTVVVHGGGPEISELSARLGVAVAWHGGRRVTPPAALDAASLVLTGRINKRVVRALCAAGVDALGLSGEDASLVVAELAEGGALGRVGRVRSVRAEVLEWLLARGLTPVVSPVSGDGAGGALNVNADEVAAAVAVALGAEELFFLTDVPGVRGKAGASGGAGILQTLDSAAVVALVAEGVASGGMAVKLEAAVAALGAGVARVRIGSAAALVDPAGGTAVHPHLEAVA